MFGLGGEHRVGADDREPTEPKRRAGLEDPPTPGGRA